MRSCRAVFVVVAVCSPVQTVNHSLNSPDTAPGECPLRCRSVTSPSAALAPSLRHRLRHYHTSNKMIKTINQSCYSLPVRQLEKGRCYSQLCHFGRVSVVLSLSLSHSLCVCVFARTKNVKLLTRNSRNVVWICYGEPQRPEVIWFRRFYLKLWPWKLFSYFSITKLLVRFWYNFTLQGILVGSVSRTNVKTMTTRAKTDGSLQICVSSDTADKTAWFFKLLYFLPIFRNAN